MTEGIGVAFALLAIGSVASALVVIASRNLVHAALAMVVNFGLTAGLYVLLQAPFVAMAQVIVYAGAIMVLFLFVVMVMGEREAALSEPLGLQRLLAVLGLAILAGILVFVVSEGVPSAAPGSAQIPPPAPESFGSTAQLADTLFRWHVLPFEIVSVLLLVAIIGAVALARPLRGNAGSNPESDDAGDTR